MEPAPDPQDPDDEFEPHDVAYHDFENGNYHGWVTRGGVGQVTLTDEAAHSGTHSLKMTGRSAEWHMPRVEITGVLEHGATYEIELYVRLGAGSGTADMELVINTTPGGEANISGDLVTVGDSEWVKLSGRYTYPVGATNAYVYVYARNNVTAPILADDLRVRIIVPGNGGPDPQPPETVVWDFEDGTTMGWGPRGNETVEVTDEAAHGGQYSLKVSNRSESWQGPSADVKAIMWKNTTYNISAWVKLAAAPEQPGQIRLVMENKAAGATSTNYTWVYKDYFEIGAAVEPQHLTGVHKELLDYHYNSLVAENAMKPASINPRENEYNWNSADLIADFARRNGMNLRFHTLLWHQQGADWMLKDNNGNWLEPTEENKQLVLQRLETYLREVVGRYKDVFRDWDVVNEVIDESQPDGMRRSKWYELTGLDYIRTAFRVTREVAGPDAKLYINDYSTHNPKKRDFLFDLVTKLRDEGVPIDGVGHQTHINITAPPVDLIVESIRKFGEAGFDNQITELDVSVYTNNTDAYQEVPAELLNRQGYRYKELFEALKRVDKEGRQKGIPGGYISNVTFWGIADDHTWLHNRPIPRQDAPFPFDKQYRAKPAYWGMVDPSKLPVVPKEGKAVAGSPRIDGKMEFEWNLAAPLKTDAIGTLSAEFRTLWHKQNLFAYITVHDESVSPDDKVELFVSDGGKRKKVTRSRGQPGTREIGYVVEAAIPLNHVAVTGDQVRFDLRVTDTGVDDGSEHGKNGAIISWSDPRNAQDEDEAGYGILTLAAAPKSAKAKYGKPVIDGKRDAVWNKASELTTRVRVEGSGGATAKFRTLWDDQHLYVYAEVTDPLLSDASSNPWEQDSVEIFVDQNNGKTSAYEEDDGQYRISFRNVRTFGGHAFEDNCRSEVRVTKHGYIVEAAIALDMIQPQNGTVLSFDFQVNDDADGDGKRDSVVIWSDPSGQSYQNTSGLGVLELAGKPGSSGG